MAIVNAAARDATRAAREDGVARLASTIPRSSSPRAKPVAETSAQTQSRIPRGWMPRNSTKPPTVSGRIGVGNRATNCAASADIEAPNAALAAGLCPAIW